MVKLIRLIESNGRYTFEDIYVNGETVSTVRENTIMKGVLLENEQQFPPGLSLNTRFSTIETRNNSYTVVGDPDTINKKLNLNEGRQLLKG